MAKGDLRNRIDVTARKDAAGKVTQYGYDPIGRLTSVTQDPGGLNQVTQYAYDEVGSRTAQTDALNRITTYEYDMRGRRTKRTLPLGQVESYSYNAVGNLTARTDFNGKITTYAYDAANRLLSKTPDASFAAAPITFTYNNDGQRLSMSDPSGTSTYVINNMHRLTSRSTPNQSALGYLYDATGNVTKIFSGAYVVDYTYDVLNRLKTVANTQTGTSTYNYDPNGNLADVTAPNSVQHAYTYNAKNQLTNLNVGIAGVPPPLRTYAYALAPTGHRLSVAELSGRSATYTYDNIYRLTSETIAGDTAATPQDGAINYTYDAVGNRQTRGSTVPAIPAIPAGVLFYDANDRTTGGADIYDANGNTVGSAGFAVTYDFENRLVKRQDPAVANDDIIIVYNGDGERVEKRVQTGPTTFLTTRYLVDNLNPTGYSQVLVETVLGQNAQRQYVYGLDLISQRRQLTSTTFEVRYFGYDGHGSTRFLTDSAAAVTDTFDYDAFGNLLTRTGTTPTHYLYAGEQFDADLNLYYNRARYLDVRVGRFWTMDPYEGDSQSPGSLHKYLYCGGNVTFCVDPSGRDGSLLGTVAALAVRFPILTQTVLGAAAGGVFGCAAGALDRDSSCTEGFYGGLLGGAAFGALGGAYAGTSFGASFAGRILFGAAGVGLAGKAAYSAMKQKKYGLAAFYTVTALTAAFLTVIAARAAQSGPGESHSASAYQKFKAQLTREEAESAFTKGGELHPDLVKSSAKIIEGDDLSDPSVIAELTADGSSISNWGKYTTPTIRTPMGNVQIHFYKYTLGNASKISFYGIKFKFN